MGEREEIAFLGPFWAATVGGDACVVLGGDAGWF